ncbi:hypothetical protein [Pseudoroseicyclus aestuarii]|uniref:Lipoprotein n=1 Tax=Pseudoroseicyclus aestuarii TaxID=1795041 RepID=A0A318T6W2_9RHOB|nr:hypothetical protein [Pseudoroseicyclus aestuarii]PYE84148.1 hypothetical protein DFP88_103515 [Pseudoroseicyclus aestuarii]
MRAAVSATLALTAPMLGLAGCGESAASAAAEGVTYEGVETRLLDGDLVAFDVALRGAEGPEAVIRYAECAAAQYTLIRGYGFARHIRTQVAEEGGRWDADAVYTISPALPRGLRTIDAEVTVASCGQSGIPTV